MDKGIQIRAYGGECRSMPIAPDNFWPESKNPIIAAFFRNIGMADELGSGVRRLFKYCVRYSGQDPQIIDGDIFQTVVPLDDSFSFDVAMDDALANEHKKQLNNAQDNAQIKAQIKRGGHGGAGCCSDGGGSESGAGGGSEGGGAGGGCAINEAAVIGYLRANPTATQIDAAKAIGKSRRTVQLSIAALKKKGLLARDGAKKNGRWIVGH